MANSMRIVCLSDTHTMGEYGTAVLTGKQPHPATPPPKKAGSSRSFDNFGTFGNAFNSGFGKF